MNEFRKLLEAFEATLTDQDLVGIDEEVVTEIGNKNNIRVQKTQPKASEQDFHGYKIRVGNAPDGAGVYNAIAFLPGKDGKAVRQERVQGQSPEEALTAAQNWIMQFSEKKTWDDIHKSTATADFNKEFTLDFLDGNESFWNKFDIEDGKPVFKIAPPAAEEEFGADLLRSYGYVRATPKNTPKGEVGNTSAAPISKATAQKAGLIPNGIYTLQLTNKKSGTFNSDVFTLAFHSTVDAPNAPMKLGVPGVTVAASRAKK